MNYLLYSIDIATEQGFMYKEPTDVKIWVSKDASLCQVFANQVTNGQWLTYFKLSVTYKALYSLNIRT